MVRVSRDAYSALSKTAALLQLRLGRKVSLSEALEYLASKCNKNARKFWSKVRVKKRVGRGRKRIVLGTTPKLSIVHESMNSRREIH